MQCGWTLNAPRSDTHRFAVAFEMSAKKSGTMPSLADRLALPNFAMKKVLCNRRENGKKVEERETLHFAIGNGGFGYRQQLHTGT